MLELLIAGALAAATSNPAAPATPTDPTAPDRAAATQAVSGQDAAQDDPAGTRLEDITVIGRPLTQLVQGFVDEVAAPVRGRNLARWHRGVCVGVANLEAEAAQYIVDRVSTVAEDLGLSPGQPGCTPNILVIATDQPDELARNMVDRVYHAFRPGGSGMEQGYSALQAFIASDSPVRWWSVSIPSHSDTGERVVRLPGECNNDCSSPMDMAPIVRINPPSRLRTQIVDNLNRVIVIVDVNQTSDLTVLQLADYVAMVSLAQIDPKADTGAYASILNVFNEPDLTDSLTDWDLAYLGGLYSAHRGRGAFNANRTEITTSIVRAHGRQRDDDN